MFPTNGKRLDGEWADKHAGECAGFVTKAFVAARCAARQLATEESSKAAVADLEAKVAALEKEKEALQ